MSIFKTKNYRGYRIKVEVEQDQALLEHYNPRKQTTLGTMACSHGSYELGDWQISKHVIREHSNWREIADWLEDTRDATNLIPLYLYDHSGITMQTGPFRSRWDSGQVGYIYTTEEDIEKYKEGFESMDGLSAEDLDVNERLEEEVKLYDHFISGEVFRYAIEGERGRQVDSCSGFLGMDWEENGLMERARGAVDREIKNRKETRWEKLKALIREGVGLNHREDILRGYPAR